MLKLRPKDWESFQHYKQRRPVWIKLHRSTLDDYKFHRLPDASRALAPMIWLLASEYQDGTIHASAEEIAFRLRRTPEEIITALKPLISSGFIACLQDASGLLADCLQDAITRREEKRREEKSERPSVSFNSTESAGYCMDAWHVHGIDNRAIIISVLDQIKDKSPMDAAVWLVEERTAYEQSRQYQETEKRYRLGVMSWLKNGKWFDWRGTVTAPTPERPDPFKEQMARFKAQKEAEDALAN